MSCIVPAMKPQKFVRPCRADERTMLESGCRALDALTVRRCQMLLASAEGLAPATIASQQRCARQTVHNVLDAVAERGLDCLRHGSHVPRSVAPVLTAETREPLQALLPQSPRNLGKAQRHWTLQRRAAVGHEPGRRDRHLSPPTPRDAVVRLGARWKRATHWMVRPDPADARQKPGVIASFT
jgi:Winged helix-turn helix